MRYTLVRFIATSPSLWLLDNYTLKVLCLLASEVKDVARLPMRRFLFALFDAGNDLNNNGKLIVPGDGSVRKVVFKKNAICCNVENKEGNPSLRDQQRCLRLLDTKEGRLC